MPNTCSWACACADVDLDVDLYTSTYTALDWLFTHRLLPRGCTLYYDDWGAGGEGNG